MECVSEHETLIQLEEKEYGLKSHEVCCIENKGYLMDSLDLPISDSKMSEDSKVPHTIIYGSYEEDNPYMITIYWGKPLMFST